MSKITLNLLLQIAICIALLLSFYIFLTTVVLRQDKQKHLYSTWQFPMLLALFLDLFNH